MSCSRWRMSPVMVVAQGNFGKAKQLHSKSREQYGQWVVCGKMGRCAVEYGRSYSENVLKACKS
ncbi:hypothetical protein M413DRAFT_332312 [Hebeloma cylindrosporum]|uniref:Uncharacterized protein n=1 Tax=Hebeloma cylindrosporum TaxID=76867 RepID=A0A0C3CM29_HEBCY|nr:hypothetical protein M413DRAFT_332312 [Hebeloma cylindrosporum h7]